MAFANDRQQKVISARLRKLAFFSRRWFDEQSKKKLRGLYTDAVLSGEGGRMLRSILAERIING